MKKLLFFSFLGFFALPNLTSAQQMMIGVRGGVNLANQNYTNLADGETISGRTLILAGGQFDYWLNKSFAISFQLLYDQKGAHADMNSGYGSYADWTINYIEIPLLAKVSFGNDGDFVRPYIFFGPSIGFLLSNMEKLHEESGSDYIPNGLGVIGAGYSIDTTANITDSTKKIDFSFVGGLGISTTLQSGQVLFLDAAFSLGFVNIDNYSWDKQKGYSFSSRDIRLAAGVLFPIN